jgi:hypothetical protein
MFVHLKYKLHTKLDDVWRIVIFRYFHHGHFVLFFTSYILNMLPPIFLQGKFVLYR